MENWKTDFVTKPIEDLTQFEAVVWSKNKIQWQWNKLVRISALVLRVQMGKGQLNATNVTFENTQSLWRKAKQMQPV